MRFLALFALGCSDGSTGLGDAGVPAPDAEVEADAGSEDVVPPACAPASEPGVIATRYGAYRGVDASASTLVFRGIRYAAPPTGEQRWRAPSDPSCEASVIEASSFGARCPQLDDNQQPIGDEDCLFLNVWAPKDVTAPLPVMVFIHGGGNAQGSSNQEVGGQPIYDGVHLAERGSIVVTINYRLASLGWLVHPMLDAESGSSGNYGLLDQIAALRWVSSNIAAFGGDPTRVLIFGESAGGRNVCMLVASPLASGLFSAAIMESGGCVAVTRAAVTAESEAQIQSSACDTEESPIACLREKSAYELLVDYPPAISVAGRSSQMQPHVDGYVLPENVSTWIESRRHNKVPVIVGANSDETSRTIPPGITSTRAYEMAVNGILGPTVGALVLAEYPVSDFASPEAAYIAVTTDSKFVCTARRDARALAAGQSEPVYRYFFTQNLTRAPRLRDRGAYHGLDLFFVFDNLRFSGYVPAPEEEALADQMGTYWLALAASGSLDTVSPEWPIYDAALDRTMILHGTSLGPVDGVRTDHCDFWDSLTP